MEVRYYFSGHPLHAVIAPLILWNELTECSSVSLPEIAHSLTQDDVFEGHAIPAGTNVLWNSWGVHMSPSEYEEPETFRPERFLNDDLDKAIKGHLVFGTGMFPGLQVQLMRGICR